MDVKVETEKIKTLAPKTSTKNFRDGRRFKQGFTLLEVLVVLGILGAIMAFGLPAFRKPQNNIKTVVRQMVSLSRETRTQARLKGSTHRLVFQLGEKEGSKGNVYWVESASGRVLIPSEATLEKMQSLSSSTDAKPPPQFQKATRLIKDQKELPSGLFFASVETPNTRQPVTDGTAYIYFTPEGMVERAVLQITNRKELTWSLIFNPITGHADIVEKPINLKDLEFD